MGDTFPVPFGRYQLVERLAVGGMAELFKATVSGAEGFKKTVVIKRILPHLAADEHFNAMFIDEAKLTARLSHPKIAQTLELGRFDGQLYIAMEFVDGLDALAVLRECAHRRTRIPAPLSVYIAQEVLDALDFAHSQTDAQGQPLNLVHRDISPSNVLLSRRGDVKLVDFGIAQATEQDHDTRSGTLKGKYGYMSPEQVVGEQIDHRSDLFSTAIVLAEMLMGRRLFTAANELDVLLMVRDVRLDRLDKYGGILDDKILQILRRGLAKDVDERYQTAAEFRDVLGEWLFDNRHRVTARDIAGLVNQLYDEAWERKRAQPVAPPEAPPAAPPRAAEVAAEIPARKVASGELPNAPTSPGPSAAPRAKSGSIPAGLRAEDAIRIVAEGDGDAVPRGVDGPDSMPVVLIEDTGSRAREEIIDLDLSSARIEALDVLGDDAVAEPAGAMSLLGGYDLGDLELELEGEGTSERDRVAAEPSGAFKLPPPDRARPVDGYTTQEIAFDDIVAAVESALPRDESNRVRALSDAELASARHRKPALTDIEAEPDDHGDFSDTSPLRVVARLARSRATGLLVVSFTAIRKEIYFGDGRPEYVSSNVASELFGEYLVANKVLTDGELSMALAMMPHYGGKLGDTLVGLGLLKPLEVFRQLSRQVREKLIDVCSWTKGQFEWFDSRRNEREAFPLDLDPYDVIGAGAMLARQDEIEAWIAARSSRTYRSAKSREPRPESFQVGAQVRALYNQLDGTRTVRDLVERYTDDAERLRFMRLLYLLVETELAQEV